MKKIDEANDTESYWVTGTVDEFLDYLKDAKAEETNYGLHTAGAEWINRVDEAWQEDWCDTSTFEEYKDKIETEVYEKMMFNTIEENEAMPDNSTEEYEYVDTDPTCEVRPKVQPSAWKTNDWETWEPKETTAEDVINGVGSSHYKSMAIQPTVYSHENGHNPAQANAIKYISRYNLKHTDEEKQIEDLKKAIDCIKLIAALEYGVVI